MTVWPRPTMRIRTGLCGGKSLSSIQPGHLARSLPRYLLLFYFAALTSLAIAPAKTNGQTRSINRHWVATWAASPAPAGNGAPNLNRQTLRLIVHTTIGGDRLRIHLSNTFGAEPVMIGAAHVGLRKNGSEVIPGSDRAVSFSGRPSVLIPPGALVVSDPVSLRFPSFADLAVSIYLPAAVTVVTEHPMALQTSYVSPAGDFCGAASFPADSTTISSWPLLTGVSVLAPARASAVIALGDSITDGAASKSDENGRWPDVLARRLASRPSGGPVAVLNEGISGNRLLHDGASPQWPIFGKSVLARFDRDVAAQPGAAEVFVLIGINDIGHPGSGAPASDEVTAEDIIAGLKQVIARAHERGLKVFGCTLTPFEGTTFKGYYTPEKEVKRSAVNEWIRSGHEFDGVVDFDKVTRDPQHPARMLARFDSGDHLHPNSAGLKAMGEAINLSLVK